jgi:hypothetical protein
MSTETSVRTSLAGWIARLVRALDEDPHGAGARLRAVVEGSRARITLDDETVLVSMAGGELVIAPDEPAAPVDGAGTTTSATVLAVLGGDLEVLAAVEEGSIHVVGSMAATTRMFAAIELLLDGSSRVPALRHLAAAFPTEHGPIPPRRSKRRRGTDEITLLARLGLLDDRGGGGVG